MGLNFLSSIGNNLKNELSDVLNLKGALYKIGFFNMTDGAEPHGYITRELDNGIKNFQKKNGLTVDGIIHPKGETERKLGDVMRVQLNGDEESVRPPLWTMDGLRAQRKSDVDATGRMIVEREDEEEKSSPLAELKPIPVPPAMPDFRMAQKIPVPKEKPLFDATGRVIMEDDGDNPFGSSMPPPLFKKDVFAGNRSKEWTDWVKRVEEDKELSENVAYAFNTIFAAEGGLKKAKESTAYAGITKTSLKDAIDNGEANSIKQRYGVNPEPSSLSDDDIRLAYKAILNRSMLAVVKGQKKSAIDLLGELGNRELTAAVADTLFRHGSGEGTTIIQKAVNSVLPKDEQLDLKSNIFGSKTYAAVKSIAKKQSIHKSFLKTLKLERMQSPSYDPKEEKRMEFFSFSE